MDFKYAKYLLPILVMLLLLSTASAAAPTTANSYDGGIPLTTVQKGTVSGGLWYDSYPGFATSAQKMFTLPVYTDIKWARLYVTVYDGHMQENRKGNVTIGIDANGDGNYELQKSETFNTSYSFPGSGGTGPVWVNDHMNRVTSDYLMWYDLTDSIKGQKVNAQATTAKIGKSSFDGRIKAITLVVAYDDGDADQVKYWVNQGHDTVSPDDTTYGTGYTGSAVFDTSALPAGWSSANLTAIYIASKDGTYTFKGTTLASGSASGSYYGADTWNVSSFLTSGQESELAYDKHDESSYYKIPLALMSVRYTSSSTAPIANFTATPLTGSTPLMVNFTDRSTGTPNSWSWNFGDGNSTTGQNVSHTYASAGSYTVNLTVTNAAGSNSTVKTNYITVTGSTQGDLTISGAVNPVPASAVFAKETNPIMVTNVKNNGPGTVTNIPVALYASDVSSGKVPVNTTTIASLASGGTSTLTLIDPTIRSLEGGTVTYTAVVDPNNLISETNETNNNKTSLAKTVKYNGYKGKRYWEGGSDITTKKTYDIHGNMIYFTQPSSVYSAAGWTGRTETWTISDLPIPSGATVEKALLYVSYNWDTTPGGVPNWTATFNGNPLTNGILYTDKSNFGPYADRKYGLYNFDVTSQFSSTGNSLILTPGSGNSNAVYPSTLVVIYQSPAEARKQIFINEGCDELGYSESSYGTTLEEATAYAPFTGMSADVSKIQNATLYSFAGSAGPDEGNLLFNNKTLASKAWQGESGTSSALKFDVKNYITTTGNEAGIQSTDSGGMNALQQILVLEYPESAPLANFTANATSGKTPLTVMFTDQSIGVPTSWAWDFGDGTNNTGQNVSHTYTSAGTYTVSLTVTNAAGSDSEVKTGYIVVSSLAAPIAAFTATPLVGTAPLSVTFTDQSTNSPTSWKWEYNNGSGWVQFSTAKNASYSFATAGPYDIRLTETNSGGSDNETKLHYVAVATGREPLTTVQSGTASGDLYVSSPTTYATGVTEVTKTFTLPAAAVGNIQWAKLYINTYSGPAGNTYALNSTVKLDKDGDGTFETTLGLETMDIGSETNGNSYPLNNHVNKVYSDYEAQYDVTSLISATNPAVNVKSTAISGKSFDGRIKAVTLVVAYNDPSSTNQIYYWVNHGGDWSSPGNGQTNFNTAGLTSGWVSAESNIRQLSSSDANYTFNGVSKTGGSSKPNLDGLNTWDVTGNITAGQSSTLAYSKISGSYKTTLATLKVKYVASPVANFTAAPNLGNAPLTVQFTDASTGIVSSYAWDFNNDGTVDSTEKNPSYTYSKAGTYSVNLTVRNPGGSNSEVKTGYIVASEPMPGATVANFTATPISGAAPLSVNFTDQSTGSPTSLLWEFGDATGAEGQNVSHTYTSAGIYLVNLTVSNANGTNSTSAAITVSEKPVTVLPVANFSSNVTKGYAPLSVQFTDLSENVTSLSWDFGDGANSTEQNPFHTYSVAGDYTVNLTVSNENGMHSKLATIIVTEKIAPVLPVANFNASVSEGYAPISVQFTDLSENATSLSWDFGDGANSTEQNPMHTYSAAGNYTVNLTVSDENGTASISSTITVIKQPAVLPVANFRSDVIEGFVPLSIQFTDLSKDATGCKWDFGDGARSTEQNPMHIYSAIGTYTVTLTVSNGAGMDTETKTGYINVKPVSSKLAATFIASPTSGNAPLKVVFTDKSTGSPTSWKWNFGDGTYSTAKNPAHTYSKAGKYTVSLTEKNARSSSSVTKYSYIKVTSTLKAPVAAFSTYPCSGSAPLKVAFTESSKGKPTSWKWSFGDGKYSTEKNPVHIYSKAGKYTVSLTVKNTVGKSTVTGFGYIKVTAPLKAPIAAFSAAPISGKTPLKVQFTDRSTGSPTSLKWSFGDGKYSTVRNPVHTYSKVGKYTVTLTAKGARGSSTKTTYGFITVSKRK